MTEYDFSPEAYRRFNENMNGISKWVDQTEQYRSQFENAAALTPGGRKEHRGRSGRKRSSRRPPPPTLPIPPQPGMMYAPQYPASPYSGSSSQRFGYSSAPGSPGPMPPPSLYHQPQQYMSPTPSYAYGAPQPYSPYGHIQASQSYSHGSYPFPPSPSYGQSMGMSGESRMVPGYIVLPQSSGRSGSHRRRSMSYVYV